ncbi:MAG TPA: hypothetical protein VMX74_08470 [Pirellulales bacterium]|nr:hypothetical protein [Pirellulales bacterium]
MKKLTVQILIVAMVVGMVCFALLQVVQAEPVATVGAVTCTQFPANRSDVVLRYTLDWTSNTSGTVTASVYQINGTIERIVYNPDGGATLPTDSYDVTLKDIDGIDVLNGTGANLSQSTVASTISTEGDGTTNIPMATQGTLALSVTNAGSAKGGIIRIYVRP